VYFERRLDTTDEWIRSRTGIAERRLARAGGTSDLIGNLLALSAFGAGFTSGSVYLRWAIA
jgi:3-oxoacyl-[acyl-carrier-protein] synthase III